MTVTRHPRAAGVQRCRRAPGHEASHAPCGEVEHLKRGKSSDNVRVRPLHERAGTLVNTHDKSYFFPVCEMTVSENNKEYTEYFKGPVP